MKFGQSINSRRSRFLLAAATLLLATSTPMPGKTQATAEKTTNSARAASEADLNLEWEKLERRAEEAFVKGNLEESAKFWQETITFAEKDKSQELNLATSLNQINHLLMRTGEFETSHKNLHRALEIRQRLLPHDDLLIGETMGNLALVLDALHKPHEAEEWYQKSLELKRKKLKADAPELAVTMHNLARLYAGEKRYKDSITLLEQALVIDKKHYGEKHIEVVRDLISLGISCYECREYQESLKYLNKALELAGAVGDHNKHDLIAIHHYIGLNHGHLKQPEKAHEHYSLALDLGNKVHGEGHLKNTAALLNLAKCADQLGKTEEAESLYKKAVALEDGRKPRQPYLLTECHLELGHFYQKHKKKAEAETAYKTAFVVYDSLPAHQKRKLYELPSALAHLLKEEGKLDEADEVARKYLHVHSPHGEEHFRL